MRSSLPLWLLSVSVVALLAANWQVRRPAIAPADTAAPQVDNRSSASSPLGKAVADEQPAIASETPAPTTRTESPRATTLDWTTVESSDYKQYAGNLRSLGFPEELVRAIIIADLDKLYEPREAPLRLKPAPYDTPVSQRQTKITPEELARVRQLRDVQLEKQAAIKEILGVYVPREIMKTPSPRNYEAFEYALNLLPLEKRDAVQVAVENDWYANDLAKQQFEKTDKAAFLDAYQRIREERNVIMRQVLTPEEFEQFEMNTLPAGTELARRVIGMEATDAEFRAMFSIAWDNWVETGGILGLWRAVRVPPEQIAAADARMIARLQETLGPDRYLDYQLATSETGQQLRNLAARYDLSRETLAQAFQLQTEADQLARARQVATFSADGSRILIPSPSPRTGELQDKLQAILGPVVWQAWTDGRNRHARLEP